MKHLLVNRCLFVTNLTYDYGIAGFIMTYFTNLFKPNIRFAVKKFRWNLMHKNI